MEATINLLYLRCHYTGKDKSHCQKSHSVLGKYHIFTLKKKSASWMNPSFLSEKLIQDYIPKSISNLQSDWEADSGMFTASDDAKRLILIIFPSRAHSMMLNTVFVFFVFPKKHGLINHFILHVVHSIISGCGL